MRPSTSDRYFERIERVVDALLAAPAEAHSVDSLAALAHMSTYHFHRVYHQVMGETVYATIRRVRLILAADRLAAGAEPVGRIAESAGYESPQAFARAFRSFARAAPAEFRRRHQTAHHAAARQSPPVGNALAEAIQIVDEPECRVLAQRHDGPIATIPGSARRFWKWQLRRALLPHVQQVIGIVYPDVADARGFRYYSAVAVDAGDRVFDDVTTLTLPGGQYARYRLHGPCSLIAGTFYAMQRDWLPRSNFQFDARPLLERYLDHRWLANGPVTDLLIPVRRRTARKTTR
jgi:AraC family transcriptional regulator